MKKHPLLFIIGLTLIGMTMPPSAVAQDQFEAPVGPLVGQRIWTMDLQWKWMMIGISMAKLSATSKTLG